MPKKTILVGKRFNKLLVLQEAGKTSKGAILWLCKCDCGNTVEVITASLNRGNTQSCGCLPKGNPVTADLVGQKFGALTVISSGEKASLGYPTWNCLCTCGKLVKIRQSSLRKGTESCGCGRYEDLTGNKYNKLTVVSLAYRIDNRIFWICRCDCGNTKEIYGYSVKKGLTKSCGCLQKVSTLQSTFKTLLDRYVTGARKRNLSFNLTKEQFREITSQDCYYCGIEPSSKIKTIKGISYIYNGIDRKNNNVGYEYQNCVPSCSFCNTAKMAYGYDEFLVWLDRIAQFQKRVPIEVI